MWLNREAGIYSENCWVVFQAPTTKLTVFRDVGNFANQALRTLLHLAILSYFSVPLILLSNKTENFSVLPPDECEFSNALQ